MTCCRPPWARGGRATGPWASTALGPAAGGHHSGAAAGQGVAARERGGGTAAHTPGQQEPCSRGRGGSPLALAVAAFAQASSPRGWIPGPRGLV